MNITIISKPKRLDYREFVRNENNKLVLKSELNKKVSVN